LKFKYNDHCQAWVRARLCKLQKECTRFAAASDKVCQLLAYGRWFSPDTPTFSTTKTGRHDIAEILLKVALSTKIQTLCCQRHSILTQINELIYNIQIAQVIHVML
jgi:hypothetical protein